MGVIGIIYEARPNVTADAAALCFKAGSSILLRGSSSAFHSNAALVRVMRKSSKSRASRRTRSAWWRIPPTGGRPDAEAAGVCRPHRAPRRRRLIQNAVLNSTVPVLETGTGNCHVYIDEGADYDTAEAVVINAKTQRTGVCNAMETLLVQEDWAKEHLERLLGP